MPSGHIRTFEEIEETVNNLGYELLDEYVEKKYKRRIVIQDTNGYKWDGQLGRLIEKKKGRFFDVSNPHMLENISLWLKSNKPEFELLKGNVYEGTKNKLKFFHNTPKCQEEFYMSWDNIFHGQGCPVCRGMQVGKRNSLAYLHPDLKKEWHQDNEKIPEQVVCGCNERVYWICSVCGYGKNKEWFVSVSNRTNRKSGCPSCCGLVVSDKNRLSITHPKIALDWDHDKNEDTPDDVSYASNKIRWWICPKLHSYTSSVGGRTSGRGCKQCADLQKESLIATELKQWCKNKFKDIDPEHRVIINPKTRRWLRCDIYLGKSDVTSGVYIEVHGKQHYNFISHWHITKEYFEDCKYRDKIKKQYAKKNGTYIEIDLRKIKTTEQAIEYIVSKL